MVTWEELKKEWQELPKNRKWDIIAFIIGIVGCTILIIVGITQMKEYMDLVSDEIKYFGGGIFIASAGFFVFNYLYTKALGNRVERYYKELKKDEN